MRLADCEITHRHIRGHNVAFLFGLRGISPLEVEELAAEWLAVYGPVALPGYVSPDGWQSLALARPGPIAARLAIDEQAKCIEFDGVKFAAELLSAFAEPTPDGKALRVMRVEHGCAAVEIVDLPAPAPERRAAAPAPKAKAGAVQTSAQPDADGQATTSGQDAVPAVDGAPAAPAAAAGSGTTAAGEA